MNLMEQFARHLEFIGFGAYASEEEAGNIFYGQMPDEPDEATGVFSQDSATPGSASGARLQVYTRGAVGDAKTPYETACAMASALEGFIGFLYGDGAFVRIEGISCAQGMGLDDSGRHIYSSQYRVYYCDF